MKKLFLVRHGQTDYNKKKIVQGSGINSNLNTKGLKQAQAFFDAHKMEGFEVVFVSPLNRTLQTVELFERAGLPFHQEPALKEISWGVHEGKTPSSKMKKEFNAMLEDWTLGKTHLAVEDGESPDDVTIRLNEFLSRLKAREEEKILICSHGRTLRILLCALMGLPASEMHQFHTDNLGLHILNWDGKGSCELLAMNERSKMKEQLKI